MVAGVTFQLIGTYNHGYSHSAEKLSPYGLMTIYGLMGTYLEHPT